MSILIGGYSNGVIASFNFVIGGYNVGAPVPDINGTITNQSLTITVKSKSKTPSYALTSKTERVKT